MANSAHKIHLLHLEKIIQRAPSAQIFAEPVKESVVADYKTAVCLGAKIMGADFDKFLWHAGLKILQDADLAGGFDLGFADSAHELPTYRKWTQQSAAFKTIGFKSGALRGVPVWDSTSITFFHLHVIRVDLPFLCHPLCHGICIINS